MSTTRSLLAAIGRYLLAIALWLDRCVLAIGLWFGTKVLRLVHTVLDCFFTDAGPPLDDKAVVLWFDSSGLLLPYHIGVAEWEGGRAEPPPAETAEEGQITIARRVAGTGLSGREAGREVRASVVHPEGCGRGQPKPYWVLQRESDPAHTAGRWFTLPADFPGRGCGR